jgi:hypothetical protein
MTIEDIQKIIEGYDLLETLTYKKLKEFQEIDQKCPISKHVDSLDYGKDEISVYGDWGVFRFPVRWLTLDETDLKEEILQAKEKREAGELEKQKKQAEADYQQYLKLKAKYEQR